MDQSKLSDDEKIVTVNKNQPCYCGSKRKYKNCHGKPGGHTTLRLGELYDVRDASYSEERCLDVLAGVNCSDKIVSAHSLQKNGTLSVIASNNCVYNFDPHFKQSKIECPYLMNIETASAWPMFCEKHDRETFLPIEDKPFQATDEQVFLFAYRALCWELYSKQAEVVCKRRLEPLGQKDFFGQGATTLAEAMAGLDRIEQVKRRYDKMLLRNDYSSVEYCLFSCNTTPEIATSGFFAPGLDLKGNVFPPPRMVPPPPYRLALSVIPASDGGFVLLSWLRNDTNCRLFAESVFELTDDLIPNAVTQVAFEFTDNTYASPQWWDALAEDGQRMVLRYAVGNMALPALNPSRYLLDRQLSVATWSVKSRFMKG